MTLSSHPPLADTDPRAATIHAWLDEVLPARQTPLAAASTDASFRRYFRVRDGGQTYIVMDAPPERVDCRPFAHLSERLEAAGLNVPRVLAHDEPRGLMLLTDLGTVRYLDALDAAGADALYQDAIDALVMMQTRLSTGALPDYDETLLRGELSLFEDWFLRRHLGLSLDSAAANGLQRCLDWLVGACLSQPRCFVHRDYHSRNLMVTPHRSPGILDFQDAVRGPIGYDLASLLRDVYVEWPAARIATWIERYHAAATTASLCVDTSLTTLSHWVDICGVQRHLKIAGIFCRLHYRDGKSGYLADIPLALTYLHRVAAQNPELRPLAAMIETLELRQRLLARNIEALHESARGVGHSACGDHPE